MSAYIVEDSCINLVVSYLLECAEKHELWKVNGFFLATGFPLDSYEDGEKLAKAMFELNCESIRQRYGQNAPSKFRELDFEFSRLYPSSDIQVLKSLGCFLYQSCEGNCDETPLYKSLREIEGKVALEIVHRLPVYESAHWQ